MNIWLIKAGEPLPTGVGQPRLFRTGLLAAALCQRGHGVTWWTSCFDHFSKTFLFDRDESVDISERYRIELLHSAGYKRNVSLSRMIDQYAVARAFSRKSASRAAPDIIVCSYPTIDLSLAAVTYGKKNSVPVVLDTRDLWPEIFAGYLPKAVRWMARPALAVLDRRARMAFRGATAITGHTDDFVRFGLEKAGREGDAYDRSFPFGYTAKDPGDSEVWAAEAYWDSLGVEGGVQRPRFCFIGAFAAHRCLDIETVIEASRILIREGADHQVILCGEGPRREGCIRMAAGAPQLLFPGFIDYPKIWTLMRRCLAGILPYRPSEDTSKSIPNKSVEYLAGGLPVVSGLTEGPFHRILTAEGVGVEYECGNPRSCADALKSLLKNAPMRDQMEQRARALFAERFVAERVYGEMAEHIEEIAKSYGRRGSGTGLPRPPFNA